MEQMQTTDRTINVDQCYYTHRRYFWFSMQTMNKMINVDKFIKRRGHIFVSGDASASVLESAWFGRKEI